MSPSEQFFFLEGIPNQFLRPFNSSQNLLNSSLTLTRRYLREDVSTRRPVFPLAYTILQTLISIILLNSTYSSHLVDCTIIQFKAEDRCLGKQADNYILDTSALVSEIL